MSKLIVAVFVAMSFLMSAVSAEPIKVVSSFSILADLVKQVGGDQVDSAVIVGAEGDAHTFEPRPSDAKVLQDADLLIINGAYFEAWLDRLLQASGYQGPIVEVIEGVELRSYADGHDAVDHEGHDHGDLDPHAWQNSRHVKIYVQNILAALNEKAPQYQKYFQQRAEQYLQQLDDLDAHLAAAFAQLPASQRTVVSTHDAFGYFADAYDIEFLSLLGASSQAEPSAKELAELIRYMREHQVKAVFMENLSNPSLMQQIARETGAKVGKPLYPDALAIPPHPADTYLGMMQWNADAILEALK